MNKTKEKSPLVVCNAWLGVFLFFSSGSFLIRASNNDKMINAICRIGANFTAEGYHKGALIVKVNRTKSVFFYLLPKNIASLVFEVLRPVPFSFLFNPDKNPPVS